MAKFNSLTEMNYRVFSKLVRNLGRKFETEKVNVNVFRKIPEDPVSQNAYLFGQIKIRYYHDRGDYPCVIITNLISGRQTDVHYDTFFDEPERFIDEANDKISQAIEKFLQGVRGEGSLEEKKELVFLALEETGESLNFSQWGQRQFGFNSIKVKNSNWLYPEGGTWYIKEDIPEDLVEVAYLALFD